MEFGLREPLSEVGLWSSGLESDLGDIIAECKGGTSGAIGASIVIDGESESDVDDDGSDVGVSRYGSGDGGDGGSTLLVDSDGDES